MYLIYAVAKYERNGRIVDDFDKVRARPPPTLEEGIEFVKPGREPVHELIHAVYTVPIAPPNSQ